MAEPYGLAYGLGAGLVGLPRAYAEGQRAATQQQMADMQAEAMQRKMAEDEAFNQAMSAQPVPQDLQGLAAWYESLSQAQGLSGVQRGKVIEQASQLRQDATTRTQQELAKRLMLASKPEEFETIRGEFKKTGFDLPEVDIDTEDPEKLLVGGLPIGRAELGMLAAERDAAKAAKMLFDADFKLKNLDLRERNMLLINERKLDQIAQKDKQFAARLEQKRNELKGNERKLFLYQSKVNDYISQGYDPIAAMTYADESYMKKARREFDSIDKELGRIYETFDRVPKASGEGVSDREKEAAVRYAQLLKQKDEASSRMVIPPPPKREPGYVPPYIGGWTPQTQQQPSMPRQATGGEGEVLSWADPEGTFSFDAAVPPGTRDKYLAALERIRNATKKGPDGKDIPLTKDEKLRYYIGVRNDILNKSKAK